MKRKPMNGDYSRKLFRNTAENIASRNFRVAPMRGGYRL